MNAIELLTAQHAKAKVLLAKLDLASGEEKRDLFDELGDALALHAALEERHFYPATRAARSEDSLQQAVLEHLSMKQIIADLLDCECEDVHFDAEFALLKEEVEDELFRKVERMFSEEELEELGVLMEDLAGELQSPRAPAEAGAAAPLE